jgi:hypothetical protein
MPLHRSLTLKKFVSAIDPELMERYFTEKLPEHTELPQRFVMSPKAVETFMGDLRNTEAKGLVQQDFRKINEMACEPEEPLSCVRQARLVYGCAGWFGCHLSAY